MSRTNGRGNPLRPRTPNAAGSPNPGDAPRPPAELTPAGPKLDPDPADRPPRVVGLSDSPSLSPLTPPADVPEAFGRSPALPEAFARGEAKPRRTADRSRDEHGDDADDQADDADGHPEADPDADDDAAEDDAPPKPPFYKRPLLMTILAVVVIGGTIAGVLFWLHARKFEKTDDAFITAHVVRVAPRVAGQVQKVLVDDNQVVKAGDLLVQLDPTDFQAKLDQADADLQAAQGRLAEAEAQVTTTQAQVGQAQAAEGSAEAERQRARADLERYQALDPRAVSRQQIDAARATATTAGANVNAAKQKTAAARAQVEFAKSQVNSAKAGVAEARAALIQAQNNLAYTRITAPQDGRVTTRTVEPGGYVNVAQSLLAIVPRDVWVVANFKETQITQMRVGQPVTIDVDAYPHKDLHGHIESIQAGAGAAFSLLPPENATGNYVKVVQRVPVKIVFDQLPDDVLLGPGMSVVPNVQVK